MKILIDQESAEKGGGGSSISLFVRLMGVNVALQLQVYFATITF